MTARIGCLLIAVLALLVGVASAQQAPKTADPAASQPPSSAGKFASPAPGKQQPNQPPTIAVPSPEVLLVLVRSALIALDHANRTGNYTVLRELGGPGLQRNSSAQLSNAFANLRNQQVDLLPVAIVTPQLTRPPSVSPEGLLQLIGFFPTQPRHIQFEIVYQAVGGQWRLFGLNVGLAAAGPPVPEASAAPTPQLADGNAGPPGTAPPSKKK
jgi:hypothetical protein